MLVTSLSPVFPGGSDRKASAYNAGSLSVRGEKREFNLPPHLSVDQSLTQTTPNPPPPERRNAHLEDATNTRQIHTLPGPVRTLALEAPPPPPPTACSHSHTFLHLLQVQQIELGRGGVGTRPGPSEKGWAAAGTKGPPHPA